MKWSPEDTLILDRLYGRYPIKTIVVITGHPYDSVKTTARRRGLCKPRTPTVSPARARFGGHA